MKLPSREQTFSLLKTVLLIVVLSKATALALLWVLPSSGVDAEKKVDVKPAYGRYAFAEAMQMNQTASTKGAANVTAYSKTAPSTLVLKGIYGSKSKGFAIVSLKSSPNTEVVGLGETFQGYTLVELEAKAAHFKRNGKRYTLVLETGVETTSVYTPAPRTSVERDQILSYKQDLKKVWSEIGIQERKQGDQIRGYEITRIDPNSTFAHLGLQQGDLVTHVNEQALASYETVIQLYNGLDTFTQLSIKVERDNQVKEFVYAIQ